ncbi:MAG: DMT family transporter [Pseudomonadota bacterium]
MLLSRAEKSDGSRSLNAHFGMLVWALIVGSSFPVVVMMTEGLPPLLLTAIRFLMAAFLLSPLVWRHSHQLPSLRGLVLYLVMGTSLAYFFGTMFWAAHRTSALSMATIYVSVPLLAYIFGRLLRVESTSKTLMSILLLGATGALALALAESGGSLNQIQFERVELAYFCGCMGSALFPVLSKWGLARNILSPSAELRTFWSLISGAVFIGLMGLLMEDMASLMRMNTKDVLLLTYLAIFSSGATFWLTQRATAVLTPSSVTAYSYLVPFVSMLLLFIEQPHQIGWHWLPGALMVVIAIAMLLKRGRGDSQSLPISKSNRIQPECNAC